MTGGTLYFAYILLSLCMNPIAGAPRELREGVKTKEPQVVDLTLDLENWMSKLPQILRTASIKNLAIPGSHDSFTSNITSESDISPDGLDIVKILGHLSIAKVVISNWSKTQAFNAVQQLNAGIRYFDLRMCRDDGNEKLYFCHTMFSTEVNTVLQDMAKYLEEHPREIVILDCQHFYNFTTETHNKVIQTLKDTFEHKLVPYQNNMEELTLDYLASQNQQVLIVYRDYQQSGQDLLWPSKSFPTPWYDTMNITKLFSQLDNGINHRSPDVGYVSQCVLTLNEKDILENLFNTLRKKCAVDFEASRTNWISNQTYGEEGVNIIIADFIDLSDNLFSKTVVNLNLKLIEKIKSESTVLGKLKWWLSQMIHSIF